MSEQKGRSVAKYIAVFAALFAGVFLFIGGVGFGAWFMTNFDIVPKGEMMAKIQEQLAEDGDLNKMLAETGIELDLDKMLQDGEVDMNALLDQVGQAGATPSTEPGFQAVDGLATSPVKNDGPFTFRFTPGENLKYSLKADIDGKGLELLNPEPVKLSMNSTFNLTTQQVDSLGNGDLRLAFENANLAGDFMGSDFELKQDANGAVVHMNGQTLVDTKGNAAALAGIPQLAFFDKAIDMKIAPNGEVLSVSGGSGLEGLTQQLPLLTDLEFPTGDINPGTQWESRVALPVPGFGTPVDARIVNTFTGYKKIGPRLCAVIEQEISADQSSGSVHMPQSMLGSAMGISMPQFDLSGENEVYFDVENGQLVHSEMGLHMGMDLGKALGPAGDAISELGAGLSDLLGDLPEFEDLVPKDKGTGEKKNLLDLDLDINSTVSLLETEDELSS